MLTALKNNIILYSLLSLLFFSCGASKKVVSISTPVYSHDMGSSKEKSLIPYYANLLGVPSSQLNYELYSFIDEWLNTPHLLGGFNRSGVDCSGFVCLLYDNVYGKKLERVSSQMEENIKKKDLKQLKEGDLVFFSFGKSKVDHVGVYLHNNKFVHVSTKKGVIISSLDDIWYYDYLKSSGTPK